MAISKARDIATSIGKAVKADRITSAGLIPSSAAAFNVYDSTVSLPTSDIAVGSQAYISSNQRLYIRGTGGWYNIATVNNTPSINSVQTAAGDSSPFSLATDGSTTTVITINATDSEGFPITFSSTTDVGFDSIATVSNDSSVFTITPLSEDSAGTATSGTLTFKASDGVNIASEVATFTLVFRITNSNFTNTLLKASGNGGTNISIDDATSTHTITRVGTPTTQAFTPYHPGGYSTYFDGTGDYLTFNPGADIAFGTGNFTVEAWVYHTSSLGADAIIDTRGGGTANWVLYRDTSNGGRIQWYNGSSNTYSTGSSKWSKQDKWLHIAYCRSGTTGYFFIDGELLNTQTDSTNYSTSSTETTIGARYSQDTAFFQGYMRDVRIIKGTALYTATFTPPTSARTAISNTKLLACSLPYIADGSGNHTVTANGNTHTRRFGPYEYTAYTTSSHGASVYFDGNQDYLTVPHNSGFDFGTADFTVEGWWYPVGGPAVNSGASNRSTIMGTYTSSGGFGVQYQFDANKFNFFFADNSLLNPSYTVVLNNWYHFAVVKNSGTLTYYINGVSIGSTSDSTSLTYSNPLWIGRINSTAGGGTITQEVQGYLSDIRIIKGTPLYTSNFTPPTSPLGTSVSGTSILTCNDAPNVFDSTAQARVITDGASSSNSTKYASASIQTGTSDRVYFYPITSASEFDNLTGDYTVEAWIKLDSSTQDYANIVLYRDDSNTSNPHILLRFGNSGFGYHLQFRVTGTGSSNVHSVNLTQTNFSNYRHVALVRTNGVVKIFVDGTQRNSNTGADPSSFPNSQVVHSNALSAVDKFEVGGALDGNIEDFRFTRNLGRYPFIPAKETLTATADTVLLIGHDSALTNDGTAGGTATASGQAAVSDFGPASGMKSIYFDGTGDYLTLASNSAYAIGSSDNFSIECWVYFNDFPTGHSPIMQWATNSLSESGTTGASFYGVSSSSSGLGSISFNQHGSPNELVSYANPNQHTFAEYEWIHLHVQRIGSTAKSFINGQLAQTTTSSSWSATQNGLYIGARHTPNYMNGYISNLRFIKGATAVNRSDSFTPPAAELQG